MFMELAKKHGNDYDATRAEPQDWLVNPPPDVMKQIEQSKKYIPNPHHKALPQKPYGKYKKIPNREFMPFDTHN